MSSYNIGKRMFEPNIRTHRPRLNDALATQPAYLYPNGMDVLSSSRRRLKKDTL